MAWAAEGLLPSSQDPRLLVYHISYDAPKTSKVMLEDISYIKVMLEDIWYTKVKINDISKYQSDAGSCKKTSPGYARWLRTVGDQIRWKYKLLSSSLSSSLSLSFHVVDILHYIWSSFHLVDNEPSFNGFNWSSMPVLVEFNEWTVDSKSFISMNVRSGCN